MNFWIPIVINCLWYYVFKKISSSSSSSSVGTRLIIECMWFRETLRMPGKRTSFLVYLQSKIIQYVHSMGSIISLFHMLLSTTQLGVYSQNIAIHEMKRGSWHILHSAFVLFSNKNRLQCILLQEQWKKWNHRRLPKMCVASVIVKARICIVLYKSLVKVIKPINMPFYKRLWLQWNE